MQLPLPVLSIASTFIVFILLSPHEGCSLQIMYLFFRGSWSVVCARLKMSSEF